MYQLRELIVVCMSKLGDVRTLRSTTVFSFIIYSLVTDCQLPLFEKLDLNTAPRMWPHLNNDDNWSWRTRTRWGWRQVLVLNVDVEPSNSASCHAFRYFLFIYFFFIWLRLDLYFFRITKSMFALFYKIEFWKEIYVILQFGLFLVVGCWDSS